jgi:hypothetical protein
MSLQEKFQITVPYKGEEDDNHFVDLKSQRVLYQSEPENFRIGQNRVYDATSPREKFVQGFGGDTDVSNGCDAKSLDRGYHRMDMGGTDDQYTGEHMDLFYGEVVDEKGQSGFVERNNYLDRE